MMKRLFLSSFSVQMMHYNGCIKENREEMIRDPAFDFQKQCSEPVEINPHPVNIIPDPVNINLNLVNINPTPFNINPDPVNINLDPVNIIPNAVN